MAELDFKRHRRLRRTESMRALVRETHLRKDDLIFPIFVVEGEGVKNEVASMPGVYQVSLDYLTEEMNELTRVGVRSVIVLECRMRKMK